MTQMTITEQQSYYQVPVYFVCQKTIKLICLIGQLRSANLTWTSGKIYQNINSRMFGKDDPPTTAATIVEFLFKPLALHGLYYVYLPVSFL